MWDGSDRTVFEIVQLAPPRVVRRPEALEVVVCEGCRRPAVAVRTDLRVGEGAVEVAEAAHDLVLVRRDLRAEPKQRDVAVCVGDVTEHLIVRAVSP